jgi:DNA-binding transcriptional MerR regulator
MRQKNTLILLNKNTKKLNNISTVFSIKDLENLSGIKAHTIRIWEKRYNILEPLRTDSNIRYYDTRNLQKLLNVTVLYNNGIKISKIAKLEQEELEVKVREYASKGSNIENSLSALKLAMLNFDLELFEQTYNRLITENTFRTVFLQVFIPFLHNIGLEWQSNSINPAHEHFITNLINQKLLINIERVQQEPVKHKNTVFVLFLPMNEIHTLGLLYLHYELLLNGYKSIYLGESVPINNLLTFTDQYSSVTYVSYFTVKPDPDYVIDYLTEFNKEVNLSDSNKLWLLGRRVQDLKLPLEFKEMSIFENINHLLEKI